MWHWLVPVSRDSVDAETARRWEHIRGNVGSRVREARKAAGLTQEALALESGLSRNVIIELEWGKRSVLFERLFDLARVLGVDVSELLVGVEERHEP